MWKWAATSDNHYQYISARGSNLGRSPRLAHTCVLASSQGALMPNVVGPCRRNPTYNPTYNLTYLSRWCPTRARLEAYASLPARTVDGYHPSNNNRDIASLTLHQRCCAPRRATYQPCCPLVCFSHIGMINAMRLASKMLRATGYARMVTRDEPCTHGFPNVNVVRPCLSDVGRVRAASYKALLPRDIPNGRNLKGAIFIL